MAAQTTIEPKPFKIGELFADSDIGTLLTFKNETGKFEQLVGITDVGDFSGKKETIDVTELHAKIKQGINGREDTSTIEFEFNASATNIKRLEDKKTVKEFAIVVGQTAIFKIKGELSYALNGVKVNSGLKGKITLTMETKEMSTTINLADFEEETKKLIEATKDL